MGEEFPESLQIAVSGLINTVVNKMITAEDQDGVEEFIKEQGIPAATDVHIRQYCQDKADEIWKPWESLPLPSTFENGIQKLKDAKGHISDSAVEEPKDISDFSANALVQQYMEDFQINLTGWQGDTIDAVRRNYLDNWGRMVFLQTTTLQTLIVLLEAYKTQVDTAQKDIVALVNAAEEVAASYSSGSVSGGAEGQDAVFNILIAVGGVVAATGGWPAIAGAVAAGGLTVSKDLFPKASDPEEHPLGGDSISEIWSNTVDATEKLKQQFITSEEKLAEMASEFYGMLGDGVTVDKDGHGESITIPAYDLIRVKPLASTSDVERPDSNYSPPDPVH